MAQHISRERLKQWIDTGPAPVIIEALPKNYYDSGHIPGAIHIPHDEISVKANTLIANKDAEIVVYCASETCQNSRQAAQALRAMGYIKVYEYTEGKKDWAEAGLPLEKTGP